MSWLPTKLGAKVRCVVSVTEDSGQFRAMGKREHKPVIVEVEPLSEEHRKVLAGMDAGLHRN